MALKTAVAVSKEERAVDGAGAGLRVDFDAAAGVGRGVVLGGKKIRRGYNSRDGGFGREGAGVLEAIDGDAGCAGSAAVGCGEDLEFALEIVRIVGEFLNVFLGEGVGADAVVGVEAGGIVIGDFDVGGDGSEGEMEIEVEGLSGSAVERKIAGGESGGGGGEARCGGGNAGQPIVSSAVGGGARTVFNGDGGVGEGCTGGIEYGTFDAKAVGALLRAGGRGGEEECRDGERCNDLEKAVHQVDLMVSDWVRRWQCRLSGNAYDKRHAGGSRSWQ